jgi:hypothetical protein
MFWKDLVLRHSVIYRYRRHRNWFQRGLSVHRPPYVNVVGRTEQSSIDDSSGSGTCLTRLFFWIFWGGNGFYRVLTFVVKDKDVSKCCTSPDESKNSTICIDIMSRHWTPRLNPNSIFNLMWVGSCPLLPARLK